MSVLVIGDGLAGTVAAARLLDHGLEVTLVAAGAGATALHGGGWYLGLERLSRFNLPVSGIGEVLDFVGTGLAELDLQDGPFGLFDVDGTERWVDMAPATHAAAASLPPTAKVLDLKGVGHPFAEMHPLASVCLPWPSDRAAFGRSFAAIAARLEKPETWAEFVEQVAGLGPVDGLLLPPILGLSAVEARRAQLAERIGAPVAEAIDTLPSNPGLRLRGALARWLTRIGGDRLKRITARVQRLDPTTAHLQDATRVPFEALVLATGRHLPGGLSSSLEVREPLADLRISPELPTNLMRGTNIKGPYGNAVFRAGVAVDAKLRPCGLDGQPTQPRWFAVGDLIAGPDPTADRCGSGLAILSAWIAAGHLAEDML